LLRRMNRMMKDNGVASAAITAQVGFPINVATIMEGLLPDGTADHRGPNEGILHVHTDDNGVCSRA